MSTVTKEQVVVGATFVTGDDEGDYETVTISMVDGDEVEFMSTIAGATAISVDEFLVFAKRLA